MTLCSYLPVALLIATVSTCVDADTCKESINERSSTLSLLQVDLRFKPVTKMQAVQQISHNCVPYINDNSTMVDRTCKPLQRLPHSSDTQSFCLCRQKENVKNLTTLMSQQNCPSEPTIISAFNYIDSLNISLNSDFIAHHSHHDGNPYESWRRHADSLGDGGIVRFDISDGQIDVSPGTFNIPRGIKFANESAAFPKLLLDVAKEVRLPNISFLWSSGDGSPDFDSSRMGLSSYKPASPGIWRTEGRPGMDILSIPRSVSDWGISMKSMLSKIPDASYVPMSFAVFRGSDTGLGWRQQIRMLAQRRPDLIDAGDSFLGDEQQMRFQVVIAPDGNSVPDRLPRQMAYGIPVVFVHPEQSLNEFWYPEMQPWVHYVPSSSLDLEMTLDTLREGPALARQIGLNGKRFIEERLSERRLRCYMYQLLTEYAKRFKM